MLDVVVVVVITGSVVVVVLDVVVVELVVVVGSVVLVVVVGAVVVVVGSVVLVVVVVGAVVVVVLVVVVDTEPPLPILKSGSNSKDTKPVFNSVENELIKYLLSLNTILSFKAIFVITLIGKIHFNFTNLALTLKILLTYDL